MSFTKTEDVQKRALQAIRKGKPLLFHWRGGYLTREVLSELLKLLEGTARQKGKHARTGLNWPRFCMSHLSRRRRRKNWLSRRQMKEKDSKTGRNEIVPSAEAPGKEKNVF